MKLLLKIQKFMQGRYGPDELYKFLLYLYLILFIINIFLKSSILDVIELLIVITMFYRFFSKKMYTRQIENQKYLRLKKHINNTIQNIKRNYHNREYNIYKKCPKCKTTLKLPLPNKRGIQHVKCPKCKNRFKFITLRQQKIEIIKKTTKR